ncbi:hypothetical protein [uncultured Erythrobacter sp.]|uniref:hypothetical protein n=1 Tax=uncultured Erythrobacter sp. TaxID=263913 RepID=UPI002619C93D|nr:hypothetical protein [uncultured Erythrobacter sp.]
MSRAFARLGAGFLMAVVAATFTVSPAVAQDRADRSDERDYYRYCEQRARDFSGYNGRVPGSYSRRNRALEGAARGAAGGTIEGFIRGEDRRERRERRRRGAIIGGIIGAIADGAEKRKEQRRARTYRLELDACMRAGGF